jgi:geranylgeranyl diphosphate synthase type II
MRAMPKRPPLSAPKATGAEAFLEEARGLVDAWTEAALPASGHLGPPRLTEAMRYSVFAGGKRLRPALAIAASRAVGGRDEAVMPYAAALELVHTYSLIHDDLPSMDDDDLRRGRPTSHKVFGEAMAILAGDALHTLAFELLLTRTPDPALARDLALELARAAGRGGMVGGQVEDLAADGEPPEAARLERIHLGKTAALIRASAKGGAMAGGGSREAIAALETYGTHLGLAFQVVDDVLDETGTAESLGKTPGKDRSRRKMTYVALEGVPAALRRAEREVEAALGALEAFDRGGLLASLARFVTRRKA